MKKILPFILGFIIVFTPAFIIAEAAEYEFRGLVPVCNTGDIAIDANGKSLGVYENACGFDAIMAMINKLITFVLFTLATPLFALILVYVGWLYISASGSAENVTKAKKILKNALIGYLIALVAWLVVKTILLTLGFNGPMYLS